MILSCTDAETALRALLGQFPQARDVEVHGAGLEEAFLALTADQNEDEDEFSEAQEVIR